MLHNLLLAAVTGGFSALLTWRVIRWCHRSGRLLYPRADRWSRRTVAQFGGVPILIAWAGATLFFASAGGRMRVVVALALCMGAVGLVDDVWHMSAGMKFAAQVLAATAAVIAGLSYPAGLHPALNVVVTILWIVGLTNAFNLLDNMDGLSGGVAIIALVSIVLLMWRDAVIVPAGLAMIGALLGFMVFNVSPARIFMGDTGSLGLGFFLACISILSAQRMSSAASVPVLPVLVFFVPIFDHHPGQLHAPPQRARHLGGGARSFLASPGAARHDRAAGRVHALPGLGGQRTHRLPVEDAAAFRRRITGLFRAGRGLAGFIWCR